MTTIERQSETARDLIFRLTSQGYELWVEGDRLKCRSPAGAVPDDVRDALRELKAEVVAVLSAQAAAADGLKAWDGAETEEREVCIENPWGRVWIVPVPPGQARLEVTRRELHEDPLGSFTRCRAIWDSLCIFDGRLLAARRS